MIFNLGFGLAGGNRTPICSLGVSGIVHYTTARLAGPERIELPPPGSKPGMISISPKADVKEPCCDFDKSTVQGRVVWRKITESNCHRCQWTGFQVQLASKASIFQNWWEAVLRPMLPVGRSLPPVSSHFCTIACPKD